MREKVKWPSARNSGREKAVRSESHHIRGEKPLRAPTHVLVVLFTIVALFRAWNCRVATVIIVYLARDGGYLCHFGGGCCCRMQ